ncbi:MAG: preprotein translocase subunit TatB [Desulfovibrionaceae bacterium CG1_02_65_16]|nr:MAG: preprotein translocase subunit TatB [Desulfovibrionaceae bacterium CG1_02_65_16]
MADNTKIVDARGLSCPQPVLIASTEMDALGVGRIEVLTDCGASPENVGRAAKAKGWRLASSSEEGGTVRLVLEKA